MVPNPDENSRKWTGRGRKFPFCVFLLVLKENLLIRMSFSSKNIYRYLKKKSCYDGGHGCVSLKLGILTMEAWIWRRGKCCGGCGSTPSGRSPAVPGQMRQHAWKMKLLKTFLSKLLMTFLSKLFWHSFQSFLWHSFRSFLWHITLKAFDEIPFQCNNCQAGILCWRRSGSWHSCSDLLLSLCLVIYRRCTQSIPRQSTPLNG